MAEPNSNWFAPDLTDLERAVLMAIAYGDIFDYPRNAQEVHRYLVGQPASPEEVCQVLDSDRLVPAHISAVKGFYTLAGREALEQTRSERGAASRELWQYAIRYGRLLASFPFVRMVALTGALAVNNVHENADIDYLIVTEPGRLWVCRAWVIALVRAARIRGHVICPNYFLSEDALVFDERNLYTAHEMAQMVPLAGRDLYDRIRKLNTWAGSYLPNAIGPPPVTFSTSNIGHPLSRIGEAVLMSTPGAWLESWEMNRKLQKFSALNGAHTEARFSASWCKGHLDEHGQRTLQAFQERLMAIQRGHS